MLQIKYHNNKGGTMAVIVWFVLFWTMVYIFIELFNSVKEQIIDYKMLRKAGRGRIYSFIKAIFG